MQVGPWRVVGWAGRGVYGAVYRAVPVEDALAPEVALKVALLPEDPRFAREVALRARADHPSIPRLLGQGVWQSPAGRRHPYVVMQWVEGVPLYEQARLHPPAPAQVLHWLAQLARALQVIHAQGGLHRDVKGENILVRRSDGRAVLTDFGSGLPMGAATLTPPMVFPGTPAYRSPESWLFELQFSRDATVRYRAGPADDLYALGVTACRLLTGEYPEPGAPRQDEEGNWHLDAVLIPPALQQEPGVEPRLRARVLRMLSVRPEERGTAEQLAEELEQAAVSVLQPSRNPGGAAAEMPATGPRPAAVQARVPATEGAHARPVWPRCALVAAALVLAVWTWRTMPGQPVEEPSLAQAEEVVEDPSGVGPAGLGEAAAAASVHEAPSPSLQDVLAEEAPPEPRPGQTRPDAKGQCPHKGQIALNGACWVRIPFEPEACEGSGGQVFKTVCYLPIIPPGRPPTSSPTDTQ